MTILEIRKFTKLSQQKFGDRYDIPLRTIQHWEAGDREVPPYVLKLLSMVTGYQDHLDQKAELEEKE